MEGFILKDSDGVIESVAGSTPVYAREKDATLFRRVGHRDPGRWRVIKVRVIELEEVEPDDQG